MPDLQIVKKVIPMKVCERCGHEKKLEYFPSWRGGTNVCKSCHAERRREQRRKKGVVQKELVRDYMRAYRKENKEMILEKKRKERIDNPIAFLWKKMASKKYEVKITKRDFLLLKIPSTCPVLGIPISYEMTRDNIPSIDRIDPNRPYESGNIAIISYRANMIKSIGSAIEHQLVCDWMLSNGNPDGKLMNDKINIGPRHLKFGREKDLL